MTELSILGAGGLLQLHAHSTLYDISQEHASNQDHDRFHE